MKRQGLWWVCALLQLCAACSTDMKSVAATEIVARIQASPQVLASMASLRVRTAATEGSNWVIRNDVAFELSSLTWPVDIIITPRADSPASANFEIVVDALDAKQLILVQTRALISYAPHQARVLELRLDACGAQPLGYLCESDPSCLGPDCLTCVGSVCGKTPTVAADGLEPLLLDAGLGPDASPQHEDGGSGANARLDGSLDADAERSDARSVAAPDAQASHCSVGYRADGLGDGGAGGSCVDIKECETNNGGCSTIPMATCNEQIGAPATCTCPTGYGGSGLGATGCANTNDCAPNPCAHDGACSDGVNTFTCTCSALYTGPSCQTYACPNAAIPSCPPPSACNGVCPPPASAVDIAVGLGHACVVLSTGAVKCWGYSGQGQAGVLGSPHQAPTLVPGISNASQIAAGQHHTCARNFDGTVSCWGDNSYGTLGIGTTGSASGPQRATGITDAVSVACGGDSCCTLRANGVVSCWGSWGLDADNAKSSAPQTISGLAPSARVVTSGDHICSIASGGPARATPISCWGDNKYDQLGNTSVTGSISPVPVTYYSNRTAVTDVAVGSHHTCALQTGTPSATLCWGFNEYGQLGTGSWNVSATMGEAPFPVQVESVISLAAAAEATCAVLSSGQVSCWGRLNGESQPTPMTVAGISDAAQVAVGSDFACVRHKSGTVSCWGGNGWGQLGLDPAQLQSSASPVAVGL